MEFPSRSGGAQGGLVKANLFAQSGMPAYSNTRHGDGVIHTKDGRISITRDQPQEVMPYLMSQFYTNGRIGTQREGVEADVPSIESYGRPLPATDDERTGNGVFVGDGYFLALARNSEGTAARPVLIDIDDPEAPLVDSRSPDNKPGVNVFFDVPYLMDRRGDMNAGCIFPSVMACGWRDDARRYAFCVFGILDEGVGSIFKSRYVCYVGDTGTRTVRCIELPTLPDSPFPVHFPGPWNEKIYKTSWWGVETCYYRIPSLDTDGRDPGPARCYCVGPGHLLTLLVPQERLELPPRSDGSYIIAPNRLPAGSAPCLLRSRDFGETWSIERADFLIADDPLCPVFYTDSSGTLRQLMMQRVSWPSMFVAAPLGDGAVAIAAHGKSLGQFGYENGNGHDNFPSAHRAWRFYVSHGSMNFANVPWPLDHKRGIFEIVDATTRPGVANERHYESPLLHPGARQARAYSFGPRHFAFCTVSSRLQVSTKDWGTYPQDYPVTVWETAGQRRLLAIAPHPGCVPALCHAVAGPQGGVRHRHGDGLLC